VYEPGEDSSDLFAATGYNAELAAIAARYMNFTPSIRLTKGFGSLKNGSWNGMVGALTRNVSSLLWGKIWRLISIRWRNDEGISRKRS